MRENFLDAKLRRSNVAVLKLVNVFLSEVFHAVAVYVVVASNLALLISIRSPFSVMGRGRTEPVPDCKFSMYMIHTHIHDDQSPTTINNVFVNMSGSMFMSMFLMWLYIFNGVDAFSQLHVEQA